MLLDNSLFGQGGLTSLLQHCQQAIQYVSTRTAFVTPQIAALNPPQTWSHPGEDASLRQTKAVHSPHQLLPSVATPWNVSRTSVDCYTQQHTPMPHQPQEPLSWAQRIQVGEAQKRSSNLDADLEQDFLPGNDVEDADLGWNPGAHEPFSSGRGGGQRMPRHGKGGRRGRR
jgi:hypothetical protein